jgi:hypothetical protein
MVFIPYSMLSLKEMDEESSWYLVLMDDRKLLFPIRQVASLAKTKKIASSFILSA